MKTTVREPKDDAVLKPTQAEQLRDLLGQLESLDFAGIQKDLGNYEGQPHAMDVLVCSSNCLGVN